MGPVVSRQDPGRLTSQYRDGLALFFVSRKRAQLLPEVCGNPLATPFRIIISSQAISSSAEGQGLQHGANIIPDIRVADGLFPRKASRLRARTPPEYGSFSRSRVVLNSPPGLWNYLMFGRPCYKDFGWSRRTS